MVAIFGIDFSRLFVKKTGTIIEQGFIGLPPIIGNILQGRANSYAIYDMYTKNPGYDVVFYPTYEVETSGIPILFTTTKAKVTARLGKLKK